MVVVRVFFVLEQIAPLNHLEMSLLTRVLICWEVAPLRVEYLGVADEALQIGNSFAHVLLSHRFALYEINSKL